MPQVLARILGSFTLLFFAYTTVVWGKVPVGRVSAPSAVAAATATPGMKSPAIQLHKGIIIFIVGLTAAVPTAYRQYSRHSAIKNVQTLPYPGLNGTSATIGQIMKDGYPKGEWFAFKESNGTFTVAFRADELFSSALSNTPESLKLCLAREECKAVLLNAQNNCPSSGDIQVCMAQQLSQAANTPLPVIVRWTVNSDHSVQLLSNNLGF
jgi:hypothetical protein